MKLSSRDVTPSVLLAWKSLSFFALAPDQQIAKFGPAEEWFCRETSSANQGANYLIGVALIYIQYYGAMYDKVDPEVALIEEIAERLKLMLGDKSPAIWGSSSLRSSQSWRDIRHLSEDALEFYGLQLNPPKNPFNIPELIEVDGYR